MTMSAQDWQDRYHEAEARHSEFIAMSGEEHRRAIAKLERELTDAKAAEGLATRMLTEANDRATAKDSYAAKMKQFIEALPCPNPLCHDGSVQNTGPDPVDEPCEWCMHRHFLLAGEPPFKCCGASDTPCLTFEAGCKNPKNYPNTPPDSGDAACPNCAGQRMKGALTATARSRNYVADREVDPTKVTFANGRTVEIRGNHLVVGMVDDASPEIPSQFPSGQSYANKPDDDVLPLDEFVKDVQAGCFIDYDGTGYYATEKERFPDYPARPSDIKRGIIDRRFTHVAWFNK